MLDANKLYHELDERASLHATNRAAFQQLDDSEKSVLAKYTLQHQNTEKSHAAAETKARASSEYQEFLAEKAKLNHAFLLAKAKHETLIVYIDLIRANQAFERTRMGLV